MRIRGAFDVVSRAQLRGYAAMLAEVIDEAARWVGDVLTATSERLLITFTDSAEASARKHELAIVRACGCA